MRNNAQDANLPRRVDNRGDGSLPSATAASATAASATGDLPGWIDGPGGRDLSGPATATAAASGTSVGRTRLNLTAGALAPA